MREALPLIVNATNIGNPRAARSAQAARLVSSVATARKLDTVRVMSALVGGVRTSRDFMIIATLRFNVARNPRFVR